MDRAAKSERERLEELWETVHALPEGERGILLEEIGTKDPQLRLEVEALMARSREAEAFFGKFASIVQADAVDALLSSEIATDHTSLFAAPSEPTLAGKTLGAWTLERPLGHGGMGTVWLARRADGRFEGEAAVKLLNLAMVSEAGQARFRQEGSVLARFAHPGIARLFDAGVSANGQPYLVLEYVDGQRIDTYAMERELSLEARVRLVLQVLAALAEAHTNLIVHRDLKPSNILVTREGAVKLLDFGIAKLLDADGTEERNTLTATGGQVLTPEYAAPEQVRGDTITTATDVYAVGVLLYTLLAGRRPYELRGCSAAEIERIICEVDPPRPSASPSAEGETEGQANGRPGTRGDVSASLRRRLQGDVDAIVMRAMHKEPQRRYQSAAALADDLQRFLAGRPVLARPDSAAYRVGKFVGRHRAGVVLAASAVVLLAGAAMRERALRGRAEREARRATAVEQYLVSVFDVADPFAPPEKRGSEVTARALLDRGAARVDSALAGQPDVQTELRRVFGQVYTSLGLFDRSVPMLQQVLDHRRAVYGQRHPDVAAAMDQLGATLTQLDRFDDAEPLLREALAQRRDFFGTADSATAASLDHLATLLQERGKQDEAEPLFREALSVRRAVHPRDHEEVANALNNLALILYIRGVYDEALPLYREALEIYRQRLGEAHPKTANALANLAQLHHARGEYAHAEPYHRRALAALRTTLGSEHPDVTVSLNNFGIMLARDMGRVDEGEALIREALALDRRIFTAPHTYIAESLGNLASVLLLKGDFPGAEAAARDALAMHRSLQSGDHRFVAKHLHSLGVILHTKGDAAGAVPYLREASEQYERLLGPASPNHLGASVNLARAHSELGRVAEAERMYASAIAGIDTNEARVRALLASAQLGLGQTLTDQGDAAEALPHLERALSARLAANGAQHWRTGEARLALGEALIALGQRTRGQALLHEAAAVLRQHQRVQPRLARQAAAALRRARVEEDGS